MRLGVTKPDSASEFDGLVMFKLNRTRQFLAFNLYTAAEVLKQVLSMRRFNPRVASSQVARDWNRGLGVLNRLADRVDIINANEVTTNAIDPEDKRIGFVTGWRNW